MAVSAISGGASALPPTSSSATANPAATQRAEEARQLRREEQAQREQQAADATQQAEQARQTSQTNQTAQVSDSNRIGQQRETLQADAVTRQQLDATRMQAQGGPYRLGQTIDTTA